MRCWRADWPRSDIASQQSARLSDLHYPAPGASATTTRSAASKLRILRSVTISIKSREERKGKAIQIRLADEEKLACESAAALSGACGGAPTDCAAQENFSRSSKSS
jgi:hypothetical protein